MGMSICQRERMNTAKNRVNGCGEIPRLRRHSPERTRPSSVLQQTVMYIEAGRNVEFAELPSNARRLIGPTSEWLTAVGHCPSIYHDVY